MNVLSLTGGGCFCYAQALALTGFDASGVDVFAGTSAGAANALALAADIPPSMMTVFYREHAPRIFAGRGWRRIARAAMAPRYGDAALNAALRELFGEMTCADLSRPAIVVTHRLTTGEPITWYTQHHPDLPVWELARMSMAAHTYFAPWCGHADGGIFHNDPCLAAVAHLLDIHCLLGQPLRLDELRVFSLGSGANETQRAAAGPWRLSAWLRIIINDTLDSASVTRQRDIARAILHSAGGQYEAFEFDHCRLDFDNPDVIAHINRVWLSDTRNAAHRMQRFFAPHQVQASISGEADHREGAPLLSPPAQEPIVAAATPTAAVPAPTRGESLEVTS